MSLSSVFSSCGISIVIVEQDDLDAALVLDVLKFAVGILGRCLSAEEIEQLGLVLQTHARNIINKTAGWYLGKDVEEAAEAQLKTGTDQFGRIVAQPVHCPYNALLVPGQHRLHVRVIYD